MNKCSSKYFNDNYEDYVEGWSKDHLHYGFWYENTKTHEESLINTICETTDYLNLNQNDHVLDAGSGTGGTCRYIAEKFGAKTTGITLSETLNNAAIDLSKNNQYKSLMSFYNMDYSNADFEDHSFSKIFAMESVCHSHDKQSFTDEAFRLLKNGGKLVVVDYYQTKSDLNDDEKNKLNDWLNGWFMPDLLHKDNFPLMLEKSGFSNISYTDKTDRIIKSSELIHNAAVERLPQIMLMVHSGKLPHTRLVHTIGLYRQKECINMGIWEYGICTAEKI